MAVSSSPRYQPLPWDSAHFGMAVGRLVGEVSDDLALATLLGQAREAGAVLVYHLHTQPFVIDEKILRCFGGRRVAGYVRFVAPLPLPTTGDAPQGVVLDRYVGPTDDPRVLALGIGAGWLSRFRLDDRLPQHKGEQLYEAWTRRSIAGELADESLVAWRQTTPIGLLTYKDRSGHGEIGLLSVAEAERGGGVGRALLAMAHARMLGRGLRRVEVVTQSENQGACRLYRGAGYVPEAEGATYHFMLSKGEDAWTSR